MYGTGIGQVTPALRICAVASGFALAVRVQSQLGQEGYSIKGMARQPRCLVLAVAVVSVSVIGPFRGWSGASSSPAAPAASPHSRLLPRSSALWRGLHGRGIVQELRPPKERLQPKELRRVVRIQAVSVGRRPPPHSHLGAV
ncbi:hypothetical protein NDU88_003810 [Pleurodeles waltl]|uniref:Uncharacterized protein n=1 Tax=Pleurodeles waltl TaxID=8319 RepID=A0AAV7MTB1_PLEWA|nr:hypothetical protein NDU88_003810 [Pleurodeles waltl]